MVNLLKDIQAKQGLTFLFIAHDLSMVKYISDRIAVMHDGRIVELAAAEELYAHPLHPYTQGLLAAIPVPDPAHERTRPAPPTAPIADDQPREMVEVRPRHFVLATAAEAAAYRADA